MGGGGGGGEEQRSFSAAERTPPLSPTTITTNISRSILEATLLICGLSLFFLSSLFPPNHSAQEKTNVWRNLILRIYRHLGFGKPREAVWPLSSHCRQMRPPHRFQLREKQQLNPKQVKTTFAVYSLPIVHGSANLTFYLHTFYLHWKRHFPEISLPIVLYVQWASFQISKLILGFKAWESKTKEMN